MPQVPLSSAYNGRPRIGLPNSRLINMVLEASQGGPTPSIRTTRPGLSLAYTIGTGPIYRMNQIPGVFNGDVFAISGNALYRGQTLVSSIPIGPNPRMASANGQLAIVSGGALYVYQNNALTQVQFFDDGVSRLPSFSSVVVLYDIFIFSVTGSNQFFFSTVGDATVINAANFGSAQTSPDNIIEMQVLAEEIYFFKPTAVEIWDYAGSLTAPFALSQGRTYSRGCAAQGSVVAKVDNSLFWVADDFAIYRSSNVPIKVSTPYIDDRIKFCGVNGIQTCTAFYMGVEGHTLYILNLPTINETFVYDASTKEWAVWGSWSPSQTDPGVYVGGCAAGQVSTGFFVGDYTSNKIYNLDPTIYQDNGNPIKTVASGAVLLPAGTRRCNNVALQCVRGEGSNSYNPIVEMRFSDDGGRTWSSWQEGDIGFSGEYDYKAVWRFQGLMSSPGRYFEWSVSDNVPFTIENGTYNESRI